MSCFVFEATFKHMQVKTVKAKVSPFSLSGKKWTGRGWAMGKYPLLSLTKNKTHYNPFAKPVMKAFAFLAHRQLWWYVL